MRGYWIRYLGDRKRREKLEWAIQTQLQLVEEAGIKDDFQAGYVCALIHSWDSAGYPETSIPEATRKMLYLHIVGADQTTPSTSRE